MKIRPKNGVFIPLLTGGITLLSLNSCTDTETLERHQVYTRDIETSIYENPDTDQVIGTLYSLSTSTASYSITNQDELGVRIEDGNLVVDNPSIFDYESNPSITGEIITNVENGESYTSTFTINLMNTIEADEAFITTWETTTDGETITLYTHADEDNEIYYDFDVDWGDGTTSEGLTDDQEHTYETAGTYTVTVTGKTFPGITQEDATNAAKLKTVEAWGSNIWTNLSGGFANCTDLAINATDIPVFTEETNVFALFQNATNFNSDIGSWDMSQITKLTYMFFGATNFNQDISGWDTSNNTSLHGTFRNADLFDQPIGSWDTSKVTNTATAFLGAKAFNQDLSGWDMSNVDATNGMFNGATAFNNDISTWDTGKVLNMTNMFFGATSFNQDISNWDTSRVVSMQNMFFNALAFNQDISGWDVSRVHNMAGMFRVATSFNQDLNSWNVGKVTNMSGTFWGATVFNGNVSDWDVSQVTNMTNLFRSCHAFNQDLSGWDVANVTTNNSALVDTPAFDATNYSPNWIN